MLFVRKNIIILFLSICFFFSSLVTIAQCPIQAYDGTGTPSNNPIWISCSGGAYNFNFVSPNPLTDYSIDWGDGTAVTSGAFLAANTIIPHPYALTTDTFVVTVTTLTPACVLTGLVVMEKPVNASIQIPIGGVTTSCAPANLQFTNASTDVSATTTFTWDFGDGSPIVTFDETNAGQTITHTYARGTVNCQTVVTLTAENYCSFGSPTSAQFNPIQIYDIDEADITSDQFIKCWSDNEFTFTNSTIRNCVPQGNVDQRYEYWNFGNYWGQGHDSIIDWTPWPPTFPHTISYPSVGNYDVMLVDSNRCGLDTVIITVSVVNPPTANVTIANPIACENSTLTFTNASTAGYSYQWNFGDSPGFVQTGFGPRTHTYNSAGTYTVTVIAFILGSAASCSDTATVVVTILPKPVSAFTFVPSGQCDNITVNFTDASTDATIWNWNFGNTQTSNSPTPPVQTYTVGTYTASLTVTAANTCTNTSTQIINVYQTPTASFSVANACVNSTLSFLDGSTALASDPITTWNWDFDDSNSSSLPNPTHNYVASSSYDVELTVSTAHCTDDVTNTITINPLPVADFSLSPTTGCAPLAVNFTNASSGATSYEWIFGDGTTSITTDPAHIFNNSVNDSTFYISLIATTAFGCKDTMLDSIEVFGKPQANYTYSSITGCAPVPVSFTNASLGATSYAWDFGAGQGTSAATNPNHSFVNTTSFIQTYSVTLIATNIHNCKDTLIETLNINPQPLFGFTMVPDTGCSVLNVNFPSVAGAVLYEWDFGDGVNSTGSSPSHSYTNAGLVPLNYTVQLIATNAFNCKDTTQGVVVVYPSPNADFTLSQTSGCAQLNVNFVNASVGATSHVWNFGDGSGTTTSTNTTHIFDNTSTTLSQTYSVTLVSENTFGCIDSVTKTVTVHPTTISSFTQTVPTCPAANITFNNTSQGATSYDWDFGDGNTSSGINPSNLFANNNTSVLTYTVKLITNNTNNCRDTSTQVISVNPKPLAVFVPSASSGCPQLNVNFTNNSIGGTIYTWDFGDGSATVSTSDPGHIFENLSTSSNVVYPTKLIVENAFGCKDSVTQNISVFPRTMADFSATVPTCAPFNIQFNNNSQGATTYAWDFGDSQTSAAINPSHVFTHNSTSQINYVVELITSNSNACRDTFTQTIVINPKPTANFSISQSVGCPQFSAAFTNNSSGNTFNTWNFGDGTATTNAFAPNHLFDNTSTSQSVINNVKLVVENIYGCKDSITLPVTVYPMIVASFDADTPICSPVNIQFYNFSQGAANYNWDLGDGTFSTQTTPSHVYNNPGPGTTHSTVILTATSANGCVDTYTHTYAIFPTPLVNFTASPQLQLYPATTVALNNTTPNASSFSSSWSFGDGQTTSTTFPPSHTYSTWGDYIIKLVMSSAFCSDSIMDTIRIVAPIPVANFKGTKEGCRALTVNFESQSQYENFYTWKFGDGNTSNLQNPTHTYFTAGVYDVTLIVSGDGGSDTIVGIDSVTVFDLPQAAFIANPTTANATVDPVFITNISQSPDATALTYIYDFGDGTALETGSSPSHIYTEAGEYEITLFLTNSNGCRDTFSFTPLIKVEEKSSFEVPNAFSPNPNGPNESGIYDPFSTNNDIFHPVVRGVKSYELSIYSRWGELLFESKDTKIGWDGYYKGKLCTQDVYIWKIKATTVDDKNLNEAGDLLLLRP